MPLPKPTAGETEQDFMDRCLSDEKMNDEFPDRAQRYAICAREWENKDKQAMTYDCQCIQCGHTLTSEQHCAELNCPECGGQMRRAERPGPGRTENAQRFNSIPAAACRLPAPL